MVSRAENWLREQLADGEPHTAGQLLAQARKYGIAERTLQAARRNIGATSGRQYAVNPAGVRKLAAHVWQLEASDGRA